MNHQSRFSVVLKMRQSCIKFSELTQRDQYHGWTELKLLRSWRIIHLLFACSMESKMKIGFFRFTFSKFFCQSDKCNKNFIFRLIENKPKWTEENMEKILIFSEHRINFLKAFVDSFMWKHCWTYHLHFPL